jgi:cytochrome c biogenesis protein CcdA/glutaredoxin
MRKLILCLVIGIFSLASLSLVFAKEKRPTPRLLFFYSESCHACHKTRQEVMPEIEKDFLDKIIIEYLDTAEQTNYQLMLALKEKYKCTDTGVPAVFIDGQFIVGFDPIKEQLRGAILAALEKERIEEFSKLPGIDLVKQFLSFGFLAITLAGLIDGINPCAFTVIVFFISFLALQGYKKKELAVIGLFFIFAVFLTYILIGLGIFRFLYSFNKFYLITKVLYYSIALSCFVLGGLALYDIWVFKKTGKTEGLILQLPQVIKHRIHSVIGMYYRKTQEEKSADKPAPKMPRLIGSAFVTGSLVSLLEAVCTGQLYVPTITFVLKETSLRLRALGYLLLYNFMFIVPLGAVLLLALLGTTQEGFSRFIKEHLPAVKLSMAILFFALGIFILLAA